MADVEALEARRRRGQPERRADGLELRLDAGLGREPHLERLHGVLARHLDPARLETALGAVDQDAVLGAPGERGLEHLATGDLAADDDLGGRLVREVVLREERGLDLLGLAERRLGEVGRGAEVDAGADEHESDAVEAGPARGRDHVAVDVGRGADDLPRLHAPQRRELVP